MIEYRAATFVEASRIGDVPPLAKRPPVELTTLIRILESRRAPESMLRSDRHRYANGIARGFASVQRDDVCTMASIVLASLHR